MGCKAAETRDLEWEEKANKNARGRWRAGGLPVLNDQAQRTRGGPSVSPQAWTAAASVSFVNTSECDELVSTGQLAPETVVACRRLGEEDAAQP